MRDTQLCLLADGGAELVDVDADETLWASDSDADFVEEFPDLLDENDVEHLLDYLEEKEILTSRELEVCEIMLEPMAGPGDDDEDDDEDEESWDRDEDDANDIIEGEVIER